MDSLFLSDSGLSLIHVLKSIDSRFQNLCGGQCPLPAAAASKMTNPCPHKFKGHGFFVSIRFWLISDSRFDAHRLKASKLMTADSVRCQLLPRLKRRIHVPISSRDMDSLFLSDSDLSLIHVLKSIDSRFQNSRSSLLTSSRQVALTPSSSEEGLFWAPSDEGAGKTAGFD